MYDQLIHTRCGEGIDLIRGKNLIKSAGFKVYSCSDGITEAGVADLTFLNAAAQIKPPFSEPNLMDDAYLYLVPDIGNRFLINSHPIIRDSESVASYAQRGGNFINHILVGDFRDIYPYETFGNDSLWDAKKRGEAYYYEHSPTPLPRRNDLSDTTGNVYLDDIAAFVHDGRREAVKSAIAFIIAQYELPPKERKFLVIRDENERLIELWIAAIQRGFSPRMASGLPFATRMDKVTTANKYTVNLSGQYQTQINLQSPQQELRYRGMIVGVDERDRSNAATVKPLSNAPYVLLDGKSKVLSVPIDTSNAYYHFVTAYTEGQDVACREFFQMVDLSQPTSAVLKLYVAFDSLLRYSTSKKLKDLHSVVSILGQYPLLGTPFLKKLYADIKADVPRFLREDTSLALFVIDWLEKAAPIVGDSIAKSQFNDQVCNIYVNSLFLHPADLKTRELHTIVMGSSFSCEVMERCTSMATLNSYQSALQSYRGSDWLAFSELFTEGLGICRAGLPKVGELLLTMSMSNLYSERNGTGLEQVVSLYARQNKERTMEIVLKMVATSPNQNEGSFYIQLLCKLYPEIYSTEERLNSFYKLLRQNNLHAHFPFILASKAQTIRKPKEIERFLNWILMDRELSRLNLTPILKALDQKIDLSDKEAYRAAGIIQKYRPSGEILVRSAHVQLLAVLDNRTLKSEIISHVEELVNQGVPSLRDQAYGETLAAKLMAARIPYEVFALVVTEGAMLDFYAGLFAAEAMKYAGTKQNEVVAGIFDVAAKSNSKNLINALIHSCGALRQFDKTMNALRLSIRGTAARQLFARVEEQARIINEKNRESSFFGRLFSRKGHNDSGN